MEPAAFCTQARVMIVAGKGGVGKTTVAAALAGVASAAGLSTLVVEVEGASGLGALFGHRGPLDYHPVELRAASADRGEISARTLTPDDALEEYLEDHGLSRLARRLTSTGSLEIVATAVPGLKDLLVMGKIKQLERRVAAGAPGSPDLIVVDAPAAGHAVTFLQSAHGVLDAAAGGPLSTQATDVVELITDPARCQVLLVTLPEETPVGEVVETAYLLEDRAGVALAPVVVNGLLPPRHLPTNATAAGKSAGVALTSTEIHALDAAARFRGRRQALQAAQVERLGRELPLPQISLPLLWTPEIGDDGLETLVDAFAAGIRALP